MPTAAAQTIVFLSSFAPLWAMFGLLNSFGSKIVALGCYALAALSLVGLAMLVKLARRMSPSILAVDRAKPRDADAVAYVVTYMIPFLTLTTTEWRSRVALVLFILVVAIIYVRSHIFYLNPMLSLVGYRLFEVEAGHGIALLLTRRRFVASGATVPAVRISDYVFLERSAG